MAKLERVPYKPKNILERIEITLENLFRKKFWDLDSWIKFSNIERGWYTTELKTTHAKLKSNEVNVYESSLDKQKKTIS